MKIEITPRQFLGLYANNEHVRHFGEQAALYILERFEEDQDMRLVIIKNLSSLRGCLAAARSEHHLGDSDGVTAALARATIVCDDDLRDAVGAALALVQAGNNDAAISVVELLQLQQQQAEQINGMRRVAGQMATEIDDLRDGLNAIRGALK